MSISPELAHIASVAVVQPPVEQANGHVAEVATLEAPAAPAPEPEVKSEVPPKRSRPGWVGSAAVGVVGLLATASLGYTLVATTQQRDATQRQLVTTQSTLAGVQKDAANRKVTADYATLYIADSGKVQLDYQSNVNCNSYSECRTAAQQLLTDMQAFQADRKSAKVPSDLAGVDADLGDALSAAIAADQEFIVGMDNGDISKIKEAGHKIDAAMLNIAKAQVALGNRLK